MKNIKDNILQEQTDEDLERKKQLDFELGMQMASLGPIPKTKKLSAEVIKRIFGSSKQDFYNVGDDISLGTDLKKLKDKIRFFEYGKSFHSEKEGRGFNFEGMLAGLFDGTAIVGKTKEDIIVGGIPYSVKSAEPPNPSFDSGTLIPGLTHVKKTLELEFKSKESAKGIQYTSTKETQLSSEGEAEWAELDITTPLSLLEKGEDYNQYKEMMLDFSFTSGDGTPLSWIFAIIYPNSIQYTVWSSEDLISAIINDGESVVGVGRAPLKDIRLKSSYLFDNGSVSTIQFPSFTPEELKKVRYNPDRGLKLDKIAELFGKYKTKVRYDVLQYIRKNPATFLKRIVNLYGDRLGPILKEKGFVELNESINYDDIKVQNLIIDVLYEGTCGDQEKHTGEQGEFFTLDGSENLGNTDYFKDDGFDIIHNHGDVHLSDITPEESETAVPKGSKKVKKTVLKPNLNKGPFNVPVIEDFQIDPEKGHYGYVFSEKLPIDVDNKLYVLLNKLGELTSEDINKFADKAAEQEIQVLQGLLYKFPSTLEEMIYYYGGLDTLRKSADYQRIINMIRSIGNRDYLVEDSDVFGQGLLEPIDPEEFEGDDEEWEELVSDVEEDEFEVEPEYEYTGGKTDASKGFVAPSAEVTDNICRVKGFCTEQGPITFGQLRELVEAATTKRIRADMGRGVFKTLWRVIPFFIPQVLLASVGITITRAINKIITPALKDTGGYKSWWGKAVLKAMDVAEGDYIPDIALGDDPLSKIFFISDGLLQMIRDKYKLKFARYVAEVASVMGDDVPVPEWFVENLLRDYLNQKFLLNPPLPVKTDVERKELSEMDIDDRHPERDGQGEGKSKTDSSTFEPPGDDFTKPLGKHRTARHREFVPEPSKHSKGGIVETDLSKTAEKLYVDENNRLQNTLNTYLDSEYEITFIGNMYGNKEVMRFKSNRTGEILTPLQILGEINKIFGGGSTNGVLYYLKYLVYKKNTTPNISFQIDEDRTPNYPGSPDSFRSLHRDRINDDKLQIPPATLVSYLDKYHREKLTKDLKELLECIEWFCYENFPDESESDNYNCEGCSDHLYDLLGVLDREIVKMGFVKTGADEFTGVPTERRVNDYPIVDVLEKPFPFTYNDWLENIIQEINPKFYINKKDDIIYMEETTETLNEQSEAKEHNPDVEVGDVIELIYMDDPWADISPMTRGIVMGFESMGSLGEKVLVKWIMSTEEGNEKFRNLPLIKGVDYWRRVNPLREHIIPTGDEEKPDFDMKKFGNLMVRAYFRKEGGWGRATQNFVLHITPSGVVRGIQLGSSISRGSMPFKQGDKVSLQDLIKFERESGFDLHMRGRIREEVIKEQVLSQDDQSKMTPIAWKIVKMAMKLGEGTYSQFQNALVKYFDLDNDNASFLWLVLTANADRLEISIQDVLKLNYNEIEVPELWENTIEFYDDYNEDEHEEECVEESGGSEAYGEHSGDDCECLQTEELEETTTDKDGDKSEEWVPCWEATQDTLEKYGYNDAHECQCEDWEVMYYKQYYYPIRQAIVITHKELDEQVGDVYDYTYHDLLDELSDWYGVVTEDEHYNDNYEEAESWDYFDDDKGGYIQDWYSDDLQSDNMMYLVNQHFYEESSIFEQEQPINEFFPGTLMDVGKKPGDVWQLFLSEKWAAIGPQGFRMSYIIKKDAEIWAKTGKDDFGNDENELKQDISWDEPESNTLKEQEVEQLKMFTTGQWNFPVSGLDKMEMKYVEHALPEQLVTKIFKRWDEKGIDFSILKMLGIDKGFALLQTMLLKRYLQFTTTPIPVSVTYDCNDLKELFERESRDYNLDYIEEYLCGKDSFWDHEDWYNYEWESHLTDQIDEENWKTISEIFGGVSQSVAEDMLQESSSSEEVDELIEKYDEEIDDIQSYIVWANSDETEYATKSAMATDIQDKIEEHFDYEGRLTKDDKGSSYYTIDGDLRDYVNDKWDNTEDVFQHHRDYLNQTLEDVILDLEKTT